MTTSTPVERKTEAGGTPEIFTPLADIYETANDYVALLDMPGATADGLDIQIERGELTIRATVAPRGDAQAKRVLSEFRVGDYVRTFTVGEGIAADRIEASLADGVLTVRLPKADEIRPRKITVKGGS